MKSKMQQSTGSDRIFRFVITVLLTVFTILILYPLVFVVMASLSDPIRVFQEPLLIWPKGFQLESYRLVFQNHDIWVGYRNTILYTVVGTIFSMTLTTLGAYPLSRRDFRGGTFFTFFFTFTMFFSGGLIPFYMVVQNLGMINRIWAVIIPGTVSVYNLMVMRTYFKSRIPQELEEAAFMDGCGSFRMLLSIVIPLSAPVISVLMLFYVVGFWNSYFNAMIFLTDRSKFSLQLVLREILIKREMEQMFSTMTDENYMKRLMEQEGLKYAVIVVTSLPVLMFYPLVAKYFKEGIMIGAIKG